MIKRTTNPTYSAKDATFDFPLYLSTADKLGAIELVVWDKDMLTKEYLGEAALPLEDWFVERPFAYDDPNNTVRRSTLVIMICDNIFYSFSRSQSPSFPPVPALKPPARSN